MDISRHFSILKKINVTMNTRISHKTLTEVKTEPIYKQEGHDRPGVAHLSLSGL